MTYDQLCVKYQVNINFMQIFSVVSAIPRVWKYNRNVTYSLNQVHLIEKLCQSTKPRKVAYTKLINQTVQFPIPLVEKWTLELDDPLLNQNVISSSFMKLYTTTVSSNIQSFQYRLTHKLMGTNSKLYKWGIRLDNNVIFVNIKKKTIYIYSINVKKIKHSGEKLRDGYKKRLLLISTSLAQRYYWVHLKTSLPYLTYF